MARSPLTLPLLRNGALSRKGRGVCAAQLASFGNFNVCLPARLPTGSSSPSRLNANYVRTLYETCGAGVKGGRLVVAGLSRPSTSFPGRCELSRLQGQPLPPAGDRTPRDARDFLPFLPHAFGQTQQPAPALGFSRAYSFSWRSPGCPRQPT